MRLTLQMLPICQRSCLELLWTGFLGTAKVLRGLFWWPKDQVSAFADDGVLFTTKLLQRLVEQFIAECEVPRMWISIHNLRPMS